MDETRQPSNQKQNEKKKNMWVQLARYSALAFVLPTATVVGWLVGAALDRWLETKWLYLAGLRSEERRVGKECRL